VKKELDGLFDVGSGACASLQMARSSELTAMELAEKLKLVPGLVEDWKKFAHGVVPELHSHWPRPITLSSA
jgi:hypothetical protein